MRDERGCHGGATNPLWWETEHEIDTCPRRLLMDSSELCAALELYSHTGGKLGAQMRDLDMRTVQAVDQISVGTRQRQREERELAEAQARLRRS
jgi:hypothetical protein